MARLSARYAKLSAYYEKQSARAKEESQRFATLAAEEAQKDQLISKNQSAQDADRRTYLIMHGKWENAADNKNDKSFKLARVSISEK